jgi:serine protease SohB
MDFVTDYGLFLAKTATLLVALALALGLVTAAIARGRSDTRREYLELRRLNDHFRDMARRIEQDRTRTARLKKRALRGERRQQRAERRREGRLPRLFVLDFHGDMRASPTDSLREEVSAIIASAHDSDEVLLRLESPGGLVHAYGLAASELARLRSRGIRLTVSVDRVAASGGYLMAGVADLIIAAPFAIVGSIGVVAQLPNFHRLLQRNDIDYELHTAGEHKRTLTMFGENTEEARAKFREELEQIHGQFKAHLTRYRPRLDVDSVATGEYWLGEQAREKGLIDDVQTSDDFLLERRERMELVGLKWHRKEGLGRRVTLAMESLACRVAERLGS